MRRPELLCPAGNAEKLRAVIGYGADAVYLSGKKYGMRSACDNFTEAELRDAVEFAHTRGVRVYVTVNILPRTREYGELSEYIKFLDGIGADAVIVSDIGVVSLVRERAPRLGVHISTQASVVSAEAARAWRSRGS